VNRGEVWWADLGEPRGSQPSFRRPVVIVQDDLLTRSKLGTVMVVPLTTNQQRALAVGNVALDPRETGLATPSVALVCQVMTVDRALFTDAAGAIPKRAMNKIDAGLRLALGLSG
jgi:mRNA interferase MazF